MKFTSHCCRPMKESAVYKKKPSVIAGVILSKLIIKACHRTKKRTHQRKLEVATTEVKTLLS